MQSESTPWLAGMLAAGIGGLFTMFTRLVWRIIDRAEKRQDTVDERNTETLASILKALEALQVALVTVQANQLTLIDLVQKELQRRYRRGGGDD